MKSKNPAKAFYEVVTKSADTGKDILTNITFFVGAGFSKSWDINSPTGNDLFTFPKEFIQNSPSEIKDLLTQPGYSSIQDTSPEKFKELVYQLNMQLKYPGIRTRYMDENSINIALDELKALTQKRFEQITSINYFDDQRGCFPLPTQITEQQENILKFFKWLRTQQKESFGFSTGVHVDFISTNYDYVIETILDNVIDSECVLRNTYRGITPNLICGRKNKNVIHDHWAIDNILKINGGFEIINNQNNYHLDYRQRSFEEIKLKPPELMMPSKEQNYTNHYFSSVFPKAVRLLHESRVLVIVGYSLSEEDALLSFLIRQFAEDLRDVHGKYIFYIDYTNEDYLVQKLRNCFKYINFIDVDNVFAYSGGFTDWIEQVIAYKRTA
ncbi:SIR2 family protein [Cylindrospermum sp. FACHB-282]|uniref:SIR2 family protein n=1 Tax=Cylindrospermum sp. FACHB-282 TaxID=2692794 RepID=UPI0016886574|nr:SIR2 family protein [Cylindrospermum sp. FACHB-282]MBD2385809.1 SIR2 family protein [Cylindrospermum sp. FACHB-282]